MLHFNKKPYQSNALTDSLKIESKILQLVTFDLLSKFNYFQKNHVFQMITCKDDFSCRFH